MVDLRAGEQLGAAYRAINPLCTVPALQTEEGAVLPDNAAITAYLEARFPQPPLLGAGSLERAEVAQLELVGGIRPTARGGRSPP